jgi:hypothetical protein
LRPSSTESLRRLDPSKTVPASITTNHSNKQEQQADDGSKGQDGQGHLDPKPKIANSRFNPISPKVWKLSAAAFDEGIDASFPPAQVLGFVEPKVTATVIERPTIGSARRYQRRSPTQGAREFG